jgi:hypothetical protein
VLSRFADNGLPVVLLYRVLLYPEAVLPTPVVLAWSAQYPTAVFAVYDTAPGLATIERRQSDGIWQAYLFVDRRIQYLNGRAAAGYARGRQKAR